MLGRVYSFLDWDGWSGERVVLRPDGTIPSARLYVENLSNMPVARLCYVENMFSFEGSGQESRERWQCGAELIGGTEPEGDCELIMLALEILRKLDVKLVNIKLSHVGLLKALLRQLGMGDREQAQMLGEMLAGDIGALSRITGQSPEIERFLQLLLGLQGKSPGFLGNLMSVLPEKFSAIKPCIDDLAQVAELLDSIGLSYEIDFASGEGFEYYTGMVFRFYGSQQLLGKGGRYDELIPLVGGDNVPASGFALYTDRLMSVIGEEKLSRGRILLSCKSDHIQKMNAFEIAGLLREQGCIVEIDLGQGDGGDHRWIVSLEKEGETTLLSLTDKASGKDQEGLSVGQLLQCMQEAKCC
jgi:histidyl-tRNA synthetase